VNTIIVNKICNASAPGVVTRQFTPGEKVMPGEPYYFPLLWAGNADDSGTYEIVESEVQVPSLVVVSETNPDLGAEGLWIQPLPNGNFTLWYEDGN